MADIFEISGRIHSTSQEEVVTTSSEIIDEGQNNKKQSEINADVQSELNAHDEAINAPSTGLEARVETLEEQVSFSGDFQTANTPADVVSGSGKITTANAVAAIAEQLKAEVGYYPCTTAAGTATKVIPASDAPNYVLTVGGSVKVKMTNKNTAADPTLKIGNAESKPLYYGASRASSSNTWEAGEVIEVYYDGENLMANNVEGGGGDGVFDISANNLTEGQPNQYSDLEAALGNNGANVPVGVRAGGMQVRFIQTSDNKYVQYRYMGTVTTGNPFENPINWQGVDEEPTAGSQNLVTSGGVRNEFNKIQRAVNGYFGPYIQLEANKGYNASNINVADTFSPLYSIESDGCYCCKITVTEDEVYKIIGNGNQFALKTYIITNADNIVTRLTNVGHTNTDLTILSGEAFLYVNLKDYNSETDGVWKQQSLWDNIDSLNEEVGSLNEEVGSLEGVKGCVFDGVPRVSDSTDIVQMMDGENPIYPRTKAEAVFINNDTSKTLDKELIYKEEVKRTLVLDKYFNFSGLAVGGSFTGTPIDGPGHACISLNISEGQKYRIAGNSDPYALKSYLITNSSNVITRISSTTPRTEEEITILEGEAHLYCNFKGYNSENDGLWQIVLEETLKQAINELATQEKIYTKVERQSKIVFGKGYNISGSSVGQVFSLALMDFNGGALVEIPIWGNEIVKLYGVGSAYGFRYYFFLDKNRVILEIASGSYNTRDTGLEITPPVGATHMYVQFSGYNPDTDYAETITNTTVNQIIEKIYSPLKDKTIVIFGDSITEFRDYARSISYSDYISYLSGATVINCGIGGSQLRQRTEPVSNPSTSEEAYAALDIVNMIKASIARDYTKQVAAADWLKNNTSDDNTGVISRLSSIDWTKVDIVIVEGGTNDWNNAIGHWGNTTDIDENTSYGAINYIIKEFLTAYKNIQLMWIAPPIRWLNYSGGVGNISDFSDNKENDGVTCKQFCKNIFDIVRSNHIPAYDAYNDLGWNMYNFSNFFPDNDGTHPLKGLDVFGEKVYRFLYSNLATMF